MQPLEQRKSVLRTCLPLTGDVGCWAARGGQHSFQLMQLKTGAAELVALAAAGSAKRLADNVRQALGGSGLPPAASLHLLSIGLLDLQHDCLQHMVADPGAASMAAALDTARAVPLCLEAAAMLAARNAAPGGRPGFTIGPQLRRREAGAVLGALLQLTRALARFEDGPLLHRLLHGSAIGGDAAPGLEPTLATALAAATASRIAAFAYGVTSAAEAALAGMRQVSSPEAAGRRMAHLAVLAAMLAALTHAQRLAGAGGIGGSAATAPAAQQPATAAVAAAAATADAAAVPPPPPLVPQPFAQRMQLFIQLLRHSGAAQRDLGRSLQLPVHLAAPGELLCDGQPPHLLQHYLQSVADSAAAGLAAAVLQFIGAAAADPDTNVLAAMQALAQSGVPAALAAALRWADLETSDAQLPIGMRAACNALAAVAGLVETEQGVNHLDDELVAGMAAAARVMVEAATADAPSNSVSAAAAASRAGKIRMAATGGSILCAAVAGGCAQAVAEAGGAPAIIMALGASARKGGDRAALMELLQEAAPALVTLAQVRERLPVQTLLLSTTHP